MTKSLTMRFTGNAVLTPAFPDDLSTQLSGPLSAIMPGARRQRPSLFAGQRINSQFVFVVFDYLQLVVSNDRSARGADYKYPDETAPAKGVCFFEQEEITLAPDPNEFGILSFVPGDVTGTFPTATSMETRWIARWEDFAERRASLHSSALTDPGDYVRLQMPGGTVSAGFVGEPIARIDFDYGTPKPPFPFAQEIVVTMTFNDTVQNVTLTCSSFTGGRQTALTFTWGGRPSIDLLFGNGSLASLQNVLTGSTAGHDHEGDFDVEFDVMLDVIECPVDGQGRQPLPHIRSAEVLHVPCTSTMISSTAQVTSAKAAADRADRPLFEPRTLVSEPRRLQAAAPRPRAPRRRVAPKRRKK